MSELRECPFCGSPQGHRISSYSGRKTYVLCMRCRAQGPIQNAADPVRADAENSWNTRPADAVREAAKRVLDDAMRSGKRAALPGREMEWYTVEASLIEALFDALAQDGRTS